MRPTKATIGLAAVALTALSGCAAIGNAVDHDKPACSTERLQRFVGRQGTEDVAAAARTRSGATIVRWLRPGMVTTMEFRADRLTIDLDDSGRITGFRCG